MTHSKVVPRTGIVLLVGLLAVISTAAGAVASGAGSPASSHVRAPGSTAWVSLGGLDTPKGVTLGVPLAPSANVAGSISFNESNTNAASSIAMTVNDPTSQYFRHYLTGDQFDQLFGPDPTQQASLQSYLQSHGLTVSVVSPFLWNVRGPAASMNAAFDTTFVTAVAPDGHHGWAPKSPMQLPSDLSSGVTVTGAFQNAVPMAHPENLLTKLGNRIFERQPPPARPAKTTATLTLNVTNRFGYYNWPTSTSTIPFVVFAPTGTNQTYNLSISGGTAPYQVTWNWGDGTVQHFNASTNLTTAFHNFPDPGWADYCFSNFTVACDNITVTVTDDSADSGSLVVPVVPVLSPHEDELLYNTVTLYKLGDSGQGSSIGLDEMCDPDYPTADYLTDINYFSAAFGLPLLTNGTTLQLIGSGNSDTNCADNGGGSPGWAGEALLDMEWSHALAPNATLVVDLAASAIQEGDATWNTLSNGVFVDSNSWGCGWTDCGYSWTTWNQAAAQGQSYLTASGDCGAAGMDGSDPPADTPSGVAVGGSQIAPYPSGVFRAEFAWNGTTDPSGCANDQGSTGGYASNYGASNTSAVPAPAYQKGMTGFTGSYRGVPDVAAIGGTWVDQWMAIYGGWFSDAGTSLASPTWAAMLDLIYDYNHTATKANGFANIDLYSIAKSASYNIGMHDITVGNNHVGSAGGDPGPCPLCYNSSVGWSPVTGLGSANVGQLAMLIAQKNGNPDAIGPLTVVESTNVTFGPASLLVNFGADVAGGPTSLSGYHYNWTFGDGSPVQATSTYYTSHVYTAAGIYDATVTVNAAGTTSATSNTVVIHVTGSGGQGGVALTGLTVTPTAPSLSTGGSVNFTASPTCTGGVGSTCPAGVKFIWSLGNALGKLNTSSGTMVQFTAGSTGGTDSLFVNATYGSSSADATPVSIAISSVVLSSVSVSPTTLSLSLGGTGDVAATISCTGGTGSACPAGTIYTWEFTGTLISLNSTTASHVAVIAGQTAGSTTLAVKATLGGISKTSASVDVTISSVVLTGVTASPSSASISTGGSATFSAVATCSGGSCPAGVTYTWALNNSFATLNATSGTVVKVSAGSTSGAVSLTVSASYAGVTVHSAAVAITIAPGSSGAGSSLWLWLVIAVVVIAAVAVLLLVVTRKKKSSAAPSPYQNYNTDYPPPWNQGYPPQQGGWPPQQYPPQGGYPPQ